MAVTLVSLKLHKIQLQGFPGGWHCMAALTALQQLDLKQAADIHKNPWYGQPPASERLAAAAELGEVLPRLTSLTQLRLEWQVDKNIRQALGLLTRLRELQLKQFHDNDNDSDSGLAPEAPDCLCLPHSLTHLDVQLVQQFSNSSTPDFPALTALQHLQLQDATWLNTSMLSDMTRLTHLDVSMRGDNFSGACMGALLDLLPGMQRLQHLQLELSNEGSNDNHQANPLCRASPGRSATR